MAAEPGPEQGYGYAQTASRDDIPRESPIMAEIGQLHAAIDRIEHQTGRIRGKLEPVLRAIPQPDASPTLAGVAGGSTAYNEIHRAAVRVGSLTELISLTIDELEV
jgi:hypothetical protein